MLTEHKNSYIIESKRKHIPVPIELSQWPRWGVYSSARQVRNYTNKHSLVTGSPLHNADVKQLTTYNDIMVHYNQCMRVEGILFNCFASPFGFSPIHNFLCDDTEVIDDFDSFTYQNDLYGETYVIFETDFIATAQIHNKRQPRIWFREKNLLFDGAGYEIIHDKPIRKFTAKNFEKLYKKHWGNNIFNWNYLAQACTQYYSKITHTNLIDVVYWLLTRTNGNMEQVSEAITQLYLPSKLFLPIEGDYCFVDYCIDKALERFYHSESYYIYPNVRNEYHYPTYHNNPLFDVNFLQKMQQKTGLDIDNYGI